jgi:hypothetical protein
MAAKRNLLPCRIWLYRYVTANLEEVACIAAVGLIAAQAA